MYLLFESWSIVIGNPAKTHDVRSAVGNPKNADSTHHTPHDVHYDVRPDFGKSTRVPATSSAAVMSFVSELTFARDARASRCAGDDGLDRAVFFDLHDDDGDGRIDVDDLTRVLTDLGLKRPGESKRDFSALVARAMREHDASANGTLSFNDSGSTCARFGGGWGRLGEEGIRPRACAWSWSCSAATTFSRRKRKRRHVR